MSAPHRILFPTPTQVRSLEARRARVMTVVGAGLCLGFAVLAAYVAAGAWLP